MVAQSCYTAMIFVFIRRHLNQEFGWLSLFLAKELMGTYLIE